MTFSVTDSVNYAECVALAGRCRHLLRAAGLPLRSLAIGPSCPGGVGDGVSIMVYRSAVSLEAVAAAIPGAVVYPKSYGVWVPL